MNKYCSNGLKGSLSMRFTRTVLIDAMETQSNRAMLRTEKQQLIWALAHGRLSMGPRVPRLSHSLILSLSL